VFRRYVAAIQTIEAARPTDPRGRAIQARLVANHIAIGSRDEQLPRVRHIAKQLEAMARQARRNLLTGPPVFSYTLLKPLSPGRHGRGFFTSASPPSRSSGQACRQAVAIPPLLTC
jgi:hypothetical protein